MTGTFRRFGRRALLLGLGGSVAGCGFRPLYATGSSGAASPAAQDLAAIHVNLIPNRPGQLLREALQERFERYGIDTIKRYGLTVAYGFNAEGIAIQPDSTPSFIRYTATAPWTLRSLDPKQGVMTTGFARAVDGQNQLDSQYFAADLGTEAIQKRLAQQIADQISLQLSVYFSRQAKARAKA
jgi:LPS-assembly lipoprotein